MQIAPEQGLFLTLLTQLIGARNVVEVGTFTGYSSICLARGLPNDGTLLACDVSEEWTAVARRYWQRAGVADRIDLRLAPALDTLRALPEEPQFDLAFIDADKEFSHSRGLDPAQTAARVQAIRDFNVHARDDTRVDLVILPIGDGLTLARRR